MPGHDVVVHFAAESHVDRSISGPEPFLSTNVIGTGVLFEAALRHGVPRFVHVSTDEVYGSVAEGFATEDARLDPSSAYSSSKAGSDLLARSYHLTHGYDVVITRCTNNYGPYQFPEKVIPLFVTNLLEDRRVPLYGNGSERAGLALRRGPLLGRPCPRRQRRTWRDLQHRRERPTAQPRAHPGDSRAHGQRRVLDRMGPGSSGPRLSICGRLIQGAGSRMVTGS